MRGRLAEDCDRMDVWGGGKGLPIGGAENPCSVPSLR